MSSATFSTFLILACLFAIMSNLGFSLFHLLREEEVSSRRSVRALTWRVGLTMTLFLSLLLAIHLGILTPNPPPL